MKITFIDGAVKTIPFDPQKAAELIHISQKQDGNVGFKLELDPERPFNERKKQVRQIQAYLDRIRINDR